MGTQGMSQRYAHTGNPHSFPEVERNVEIGPNLNAKPRSSNWAFFYETDTTKAESWEKIEGHQFDPVSLACTRSGLLQYFRKTVSPPTTCHGFLNPNAKIH